MSRIITAVGWFIVALSVAGALGIGHFRLYYGPDAVTCTKERPNV